MIYNNTTELEFKMQNIIFLLYENENHYRYLEPKLKLIKFNIKNCDVINNISKRTTQSINNIKVQKNEKLNKDIKIENDNANNNFEYNISYYDKDNIISEKKEQDNTLKTKAIISEEISFDNKKYENYLNYSKNNSFTL